MNVYFYLRKIDGTDLSVVYLFATDRGQRYRVSTKIKIQPKYWDEKREQIKSKHAYSAIFNQRLNKLKERALLILNNALAEDKILSKTEFKQLLLAQELPNHDFIEFMRSEIEKMDISKSSKRKYYSALHKLQMYKRKVYFYDLTEGFLLGYKRFLREKLGNNPNTVSKSMSIVRTFIKKAINAGYLKENPFANIKISQITSRTEFLTRDEVKRLEQLYQSEELSAGLRENLRMFLFAVYTGLRFSDLQALKGANLATKQLDGKSVPVLRLYQQKTKDFIEVYLPEKARQYLPERVFKNLPLFKQISNQAMNRSLKKIFAKAGINRNITFHTSRHTFATLLLQAGAQLTAVSNALGHRSVKTTERYLKITPDFTYQHVKKLDSFLS